MIVKRMRMGSMVCVAGVCASLVVGCSTQKLPETAGNPKTEGPITLSLMTSLSEPEVPKPDSPPLLKLQEMTGAKLDVTWVPAKVYEDKLSATIASGELPQVILVTNNKAPHIVNAIRSGMFWELGPYFKDYPNLSKLDKQIIANTSIDGKVYGVFRSREWLLARGGITYRKDWLDNLGLSVPKTTDELYQLFKAFTENDPDKNGKKDTIGAAEQKSLVILNTILPYFGAPNGWAVEGGKFTPAFMTPEYLNALKFMKRLYDEKLINQDFAAPGQSIQDYMNKGQAGLYFGVLDDISNKFNDLPKLFPQAKLSAFNRIAGPKGERTYASSGYNGVFMVPKTSVKTEAELKQVLGFLDKLVTEEMATFMRWGIEGRHFKMENGKPTILDVNLDTVEMQPLRQINASNMGKAKPGVFTPEYELSLQLIEDNKKIAVTNPAEPLLSSTVVEKGSELNKIVDDARIKFIMGVLDEAGWKAEIEKWRKAGGDKVMEEYSAEYAKMTK